MLGCLLDGADVLAVLTTGFSKSLILKAFVVASKMASNDHATTMVNTPVNSITKRLLVANGLVTLAASLTE